MYITCGNCATHYHLDETRIRRAVFQARCTGCGLVFEVRKPGVAEEVRFLELDATKMHGRIEHAIAVSNQKGGVAKTTTCLNLGAALAAGGSRVLLVDFDAQANLSLCLGGAGQPTFFDVVRDAGGNAMADHIQPTAYENLWLLPSGKNMVLLGRHFFGCPDFEYLLKDRLLPVAGKFDYILIDTPPSTDFLTLNALMAAGRVIIPTLCDYLSLFGVDQMVQLLQVIGRGSSGAPDYRVLATRAERGAPVVKLFLERMVRLYGHRLFRTVIDADESVAVSQIMSRPLLHSAPKSPAAVQYARLASEIRGAMSLSTPVPLAAVQ